MTAATVLAACALHLALTARAQAPSPSASLGELARDLADRIAAVIAPLDELRLARPNPDSRDARLDAAIQPALVAQLRARGLSLVAAGSDRTGSARVACSENLRETVCAAEVIKNDVRQIVVASRARNAGDDPVAPAALAALDVRPILSQAEPILDLVELGDRLLVLEGAALRRYERSETGWKPAAVAAISWAPTRDPRGRLVLANGLLDAYLPGSVCRVAVEPLQVSCRPAAGESWPGEIPDSELPAGTNYFSSRRTTPFFTAAPLGGDVASGWLLAGTDGKLHVLDTALLDRHTLPGIGDDIARVKTSCAANPQIIAAIPDSDAEHTGTLRAYEVTADGVAGMTPTVAMPGAITALWEVPAKPYVLAVARHRDSGRYEAFYVGLACAR